MCSQNAFRPQKSKHATARCKEQCIETVRKSQSFLFVGTMPPVSVFGSSCSPMLDSKAIDPPTRTINATTVPTTNTNGLPEDFVRRTEIVTVIEDNTHPLTSSRSHALPAQYSVRPFASFVEAHEHTKHVRLPLLACTHWPCPLHAFVEFPHASAVV